MLTDAKIKNKSYNRILKHIQTQELTASNTNVQHQDQGTRQGSRSWHLVMWDLKQKKKLQERHKILTTDKPEKNVNEI